MDLKKNILDLVENYFNVYLKNKSNDYIPVTEKKIDYKDIQNIVESALDGWFTSGRFTRDFEKSISDFLGIKTKALFVNSGSSANLISMTVLTQKFMMNEFKLSYLRPGDEVITTAAGFPTTILPIIQNNLIPVFIDVSLDNLNIELETIKRAITKKTKAIMVAHTLGNPYRADLISDLCKENNIYLIEDTCDAFGATIKVNQKNKFVGTFGDFASLSFYPAHHITTGEGGAVISSNPKLRRIAASVRDWGRHCWCDSGKDNTCKKRFGWNFEKLPEGYDHKYIYSSIGYNLKATDFQAALGCSQIIKLRDFIEKRRDNWNLLKNIFENNRLLKNNFTTINPTENTTPSWFGFGIICKKVNRNEVVKFLEKNGIGTRLLFAGNILNQPAFFDIKYKTYGDLKNSDILAKDFFWIGVHPNITKKNIEKITETLENYIKIN